MKYQIRLFLTQLVEFNRHTSSQAPRVGVSYNTVALGVYPFCASFSLVNLIPSEGVGGQRSRAVQVSKKTPGVISLTTKKIVYTYNQASRIIPVFRPHSLSSEATERGTNFCRSICYRLIVHRYRIQLGVQETMFSWEWWVTLNRHWWTTTANVNYVQFLFPLVVAH